MMIYKILRQSEYQAACRSGVFTGSPIDVADGFIHFSTADQVAETAAKHFAGQPNLVLLAVQAESLGDDLRWETSRGGALFPHLYAALPMTTLDPATPLSEWSTEP